MLTIEYRMDGAGWATAVFSPAEGQPLVLPGLSYLDEPLRDLLGLGLCCALRNPFQDIVFDNEGAFTKLSVEVLDQREPPDPAVVAVRAQHLVPGAPDPKRREWQEIGSFRTETETLAKALLACGDDVLTKHGVEGYDRQWCAMGFPLRALTALRAALSVEDPLGSVYVLTDEERAEMEAWSATAPS